MHQNLALILRHLCYDKRGSAVLVPASQLQNSSIYKSRPVLQYLEKFRHFGKIVFGNFTAIVLRQNQFYSIGPWSH